jgi:KDO2-lipid IV(A) lauroyltransferase
MTGTLPAKFATKYGVTLIPAMSVRNFSNPTTYDIFIDQPLSISKKDDIASVTQKINDMYQSWIMKHPEQWFWVHKRWPKELYK